MKRILSALLTCALSVAALAMPADPQPVSVTQPDGTQLTLRLLGDEYYHFNTTADGYTVVRDSSGCYVYARLDADGRLAPTAFTARDEGWRSPAEQAYLESVGRRLTPAMSTSAATAMRRNQAARAQTLQQRKAQLYDYSKFKGLVILVEYNDCPFRYSDYGDIMEKMINQDNYTGESRTNIGNVTCTGSMRDYFRDNSNGAFLPHFDVVGPVKINRSQYYPRPYGNDGNTNYVQLIVDAVTAADSQVNFKDYDVDGDGNVDMVYFIFSGLPSYITGNDSRLLWPHQWDISYVRNVRKDGVYIGRYACSTELYGTSEWSILEGIGTMTHEFSHVLGLPDLYDTDNLDSDACVNPGLWSVMANGSDGNYGRTPVNYSLYERYSLGFSSPQTIDQPGDYELDAIHESNAGYRLDTPVKNEFFLLENRQKVKWDAVLPGHGMLIFRVDSTDWSAWSYNAVNDSPSHPHYELVRAKGVQSGSQYNPFPASPRDPFPGTGNVRAISNETSPANLLTWAGKETPFALRNIYEMSGAISFEAYYAKVLTAISLPDSVTMAYATQLLLTPTLTPDGASYTLTWESDDESVATVDGDGLVIAVSNGTCTITVTSDNGLTASCTVTVRELEGVASIAAFRALDEGGKAQLVLDSAQVLFVHGSDIYVRDATGSLLLRDTGLDAAAGDTLCGTIFGTLEKENLMPRLAAVENITTPSNVIVTAGGAPTPDGVNAYSPTAELSDDMLCDLVTLRAATLSLENKMVFAAVGEGKARVYNTFGLKGITAPKSSAYAGRYYDVTGILTTAVAGDSICYVLSLTESVTETEKPAETPDGDVNGDGVVDVADISSIITVIAGSAGDDPMSARADVNGDGAVDVADISFVITIIAGI